MEGIVIIINNQFEGKDTEIANIEGVIYIHSGCQVFPENDYEEICRNYEVPQEYIDNAKKEIDGIEKEELTVEFFRSYPAFSKVINDISLQHILVKDDSEHVKCCLAGNSSIALEVKKLLQ